MCPVIGRAVTRSRVVLVHGSLGTCLPQATMQNVGIPSGVINSVASAGNSLFPSSTHPSVCTTSWQAFQHPNDLVPPLNPGYPRRTKYLIPFTPRLACVSSAAFTSGGMRFINVVTLEFEEFLGKPPDYAILSHTWGEDEVSYRNFQDEQKRNGMKGFRKIAFTCRQSVEDGLRYAWVDTCCIDKTSSAELTEAINSMFKWYQDARCCYVHLADVDDDVVPGRWDETIGSSRWFTRGWTLQELIAPRSLHFYTQSWNHIGTKEDFAMDLATTTGISHSILTAASDTTAACVGERMRWAARRQTTREEDMAYCLLGIFKVNMPLLYGEGGSRAFMRLQEHILKERDDHTIFAWRTDDPVNPDPLEPVADDTGVFAASPAFFARFEDIQPFYSFSSDDSQPAWTNKGISVTANMTQKPIRHRQRMVWVLELNCVSSKPGLAGDDCRWVTQIGIYVSRVGANKYMRAVTNELAWLPSLDSWWMQLSSRQLVFLQTSMQDFEYQAMTHYQHDLGPRAVIIKNLAPGILVHSIHPRKFEQWYKRNTDVLNPIYWAIDGVAIVFEVEGSTPLGVLLRWGTDGESVKDANDIRTADFYFGAFYFGAFRWEAIAPRLITEFNHRDFPLNDLVAMRETGSSLVYRTTGHPERTLMISLRPRVVLGLNTFVLTLEG